MKNRSRRDDNLRRQIAYLAARLVAEEGVTDFAFAKQKAARQAGLTEARLLPDNREVEAALRDYQELFQSETQPDELRALRESALALMRQLEDFRPALVGPVLGGTANQFSEITLQVFADDAKELALFLVNHRWHHEDDARLPRVAHSAPTPLARIRLWCGETPALLQVFRPEDERRLAKATADDEAAVRARIPDLEAMLAA